MKPFRGSGAANDILVQSYTIYSACRALREISTYLPMQVDKRPDPAHLPFISAHVFRLPSLATHVYPSKTCRVRSYKCGFRA